MQARCDSRGMDELCPQSPVLRRRAATTLRCLMALSAAFARFGRVRVASRSRFARAIAEIDRA